MKCFSLKWEDQIAFVLYSFYFSEALADYFQFISVLHGHFYILLSKQYLLGCLSLCHRQKSYKHCPSWQYQNLLQIVVAESGSVQFSSDSSV